MREKPIGAEQFRTVLFARLTREFDDFVATISRAVLALPYYISRSAEADVRASVEQTATVTLAALAEDRGLTGQQVTVLNATGATRFDQGMSTQTLLAAVREAMGTGLVYIEATARRTAADTKASGVVVAQVLHDLTARHNALEYELTTALTVGHERQRSLSGAAGSDESAVVERLVTGRWTDEHEIEHAAKECGMDLAGSLGVIVLIASASEADPALLGRAGEQVVDQLSGATAGPVTAGQVPHVVVLVPEGSWSTVATACEHIAQTRNLHILCYEPVASYRMLGKQYPRLVGDLALPVAAGLPPGVLSGSRLAFYRLSTAAPVEDRMEFVERVAGPILNDPELVETVETLYRVGGGAGRVASVLRRHSNTVRLRFEKIKRKTGLDVEQPEDLHQLVLALRWRAVRQPDG